MSTDAEIAKRCNAEEPGAFQKFYTLRTAIGWALLGLFALANLVAAIVTTINP